MKNFTSFYSDDLRNLTESLFVYNPEKRPSFHELGK